MIRFVYYCGGCDAKAESGHVQQRFQSFSGRAYGFGRHHIIADPIADAPDGWVAFDLIGATYCPDCAAEIWPDEPQTALEDKP